MKFRFTGLSDVGLVRSANQDAYYIDPKGLFIVADGMGGHAGGEEASRIAIQVIKAYLVEHWDSVKPTPSLLVDAFMEANRAIVQDQQNHPQRSDMGTTAVALIFRQQQVYCAHVGDSRLYHFGANLQQITQDHTWVAKALKFGELTPEAARTHPYRHILLQCLGREELHQIDVQALEVQPGDRLLLCSDGLTEELSDQLIALHLQSPDINQAVFDLVEAAKTNGGHDNVTVIVVEIEKVPSVQRVESRD